MQARFEVRSWPVKFVLIAVVPTAALLMGLAAVNYAIHASGSGVPAGQGPSQVQGYGQSPVEARDTRSLGDAQGEPGPFVMEQSPDGLSASPECKRFGGPTC